MEKWHEEMCQRSFDDIGEKGDATTHCSMSERDKEEEEEAILELVKNQKKEEWLRLASHSFGKDGGARLLNVRLIHQYLRRMQFRGSDVRLGSLPS